MNSIIGLILIALGLFIIRYGDIVVSQKRGGIISRLFEWPVWYRKWGKWYMGLGFAGIGAWFIFVGPQSPAF